MGIGEDRVGRAHSEQSTWHDATTKTLHAQHQRLPRGYPFLGLVWAGAVPSRSWKHYSAHAYTRRARLAVAVISIRQVCVRVTARAEQACLATQLFVVRAGGAALQIPAARCCCPLMATGALSARAASARRALMRCSRSPLAAGLVANRHALLQRCDQHSPFHRCMPVSVHVNTRMAPSHSG